MANWQEGQDGKLTLVFVDSFDLKLLANDIKDAMNYLIEKYPDAKDPICVVLDISRLK